MTSITVLFSVITIIAPLAFCEKGFLQLNVSNTSEEQLSGVILSPLGAGGFSAPTDAAGRTRIALPAQAAPNDWIELKIVKPLGVFVFISPWDQRVLIPSFDEKPANVVKV